MGQADIELGYIGAQARKLLALAERARDAELLALREPTTTNHIATDNACDEMERACTPDLIIALVTALRDADQGSDESDDPRDVCVFCGFERQHHNEDGTAHLMGSEDPCLFAATDKDAVSILAEGNRELRAELDLATSRGESLSEDDRTMFRQIVKQLVESAGWWHHGPLLNRVAAFVCGPDSAT